MTSKWLSVSALAALTLAGCTPSQRIDPEKPGVNEKDPDARSFFGTVIARKLGQSILVFSKDERIGDKEFPNQVVVKYDAQTKFFIDDKPTTLDKLELYMTAQVDGHMRGTQMYMETARFSSVLPEKVKKE